MPIDNESLMEQRIREEMREMRVASGLSQTGVAELFGWEKAAVSKMENGLVRIRLSDYLTLAKHVRHFIPGHPGVALADHFAKPKRTKA